MAGRTQFDFLATARPLADLRLSRARRLHRLTERVHSVRIIPSLLLLLLLLKPRHGERRQSPLEIVVRFDEVSRHTLTL